MASLGGWPSIPSWWNLEGCADPLSMHHTHRHIHSPPNELGIMALAQLVRAMAWGPVRGSHLAAHRPLSGGHGLCWLGDWLGGLWGEVSCASALNRLLTLDLNSQRPCCCVGRSRSRGLPTSLFPSLLILETWVPGSHGAESFKIFALSFHIVCLCQGFLCCGGQLFKF